MLNFFRTYQRYFFFVITVVIIISFSFFGTYSTLGSNTWREQLAFKAVDGSEVTRSDVDEMSTFIATDKNDKLLFGGAWGPNFLNDGVITKDFLETGLAAELVSDYQSEVQEDLQKKMEKEKKFRLYKHPNAPFIGMESIWSYFMPEMATHYKTLQTETNPTDPAAFNSRVKLFLGERRFPSSSVKYMLRYQEKQYNWLKPDRDLDRTDLSIFGYHTLEDWFGPRFTKLVSQFIINAAILAEQKGYRVTNAEATADLIRNTQISYKEHENQPNIGVASPEEYLAEQLRRLNMDQSRAVKVWRQVLLFRRYFQDAGHTALVDTLAFSKFNHYTHQAVAVEVYELPQEIRLGNYDSLQKLEVYLGAVAKASSDPLALPTQYLAESEVAKNYPELVQRRYALEIAQVNKNNLQASIALKDIWNWEADDANWEGLKKQFPELALKPAKTREERIEAIDSLDKITRSKVDAFAKDAILKNHPDWIQDGLDKAPAAKQTIGLRTEGGKSVISGLSKKEDRKALMKLLDEATLGAAPAKNHPLNGYTADNQVYYRITVLAREPKGEVLTFAEANSDGTLDAIRNRVLEKHYVDSRDQSPLLYQTEGKEWRPFNSVKELVANQYFADKIAALENVYKKTASDKNAGKMTNDKAASLRFYPYIEKVKAQIVKDPTQAEKYVRKQSPKTDQELAYRAPLADQWRLEKVVKDVNRQEPESVVETTEVFALPPQGWSTLKTPPNGQLAFYQVKEKSLEDDELAEAIETHTREAQAVLSAEAQRLLMRSVLEEIKAKDAISLAYLSIKEEPVERQEPIQVSPDF